MYRSGRSNDKKLKQASPQRCRYLHA